MSLTSMVLGLASVALVLAGCASNQTPSMLSHRGVAAGAPNATTRAVIKAVTATGFPIAHLLVKLTRKSDTGALIAKGLTNAKGKVTLSGDFGSGYVCASAIHKRQTSEFCSYPFPSRATIKFL
jgi:hypothetical protein